MSASAINAPAPTQPGPAAGNAAGAAAAQGPLAGFEALLAAFFGAQGETLVPGAAGKTATTAKSGATSGMVVEGSEGAVDVSTSKSADELKAASDAAAAAGLAVCNTVVVPATPLPIVDTPVTTAADGVSGKAAEAAAFGLAKAATPTLAQGLKGETTEAGAETPGAEIDPNAQPTLTTAKVDASLAGKQSAPAPTQVATPPQTPPPATAPAAPVAAPAIPLDASTQPAAQALAAQQAATEAAATEKTAPAAPVAPSKAQAAKPGRNEHGRVDAAIAAPVRTGGAATAPVLEAAPVNGADDDAAQPSVTDIKGEAADASGSSADAGAATASTTTPATLVHPGALPVRGSPQTVANFAAQIAKKLEGRSTRFDLQLDPAGLGRVDVRMEIGASGRMTAAMTFDTPAAAAELRSRAAELQRHLEQAGFDMSGGLSFDVAGDRGQGRPAPQNQDNDNGGQAFRGRAFQTALATAGEAAQSAASGALNLHRSRVSGVDVRI